MRLRVRVLGLRVHSHVCTWTHKYGVTSALRTLPRPVCTNFAAIGSTRSVDTAHALTKPLVAHIH